MAIGGYSSAPPIDLSVDERLLLGQCLSDLSAITVSQATSFGVLVDGASERPIQTTGTAIAGLVRAAEQNAARWRRLTEVTDFITEMATRVSDQHVDLALQLAGMHEHPSTEPFRTRASDEGGPSIFVRSRVDRIAAEFAHEHDRAIEVYALISRWPDGLGEDGTSAGILARHDALGCAIGIADVAVGGVGLGVAIATEVLSVGASTPLSIGLATVSASVAGYGAGMASEAC